MSIVVYYSVTNQFNLFWFLIDLRDLRNVFFFFFWKAQKWPLALQKIKKELATLFYCQSFSDYFPIQCVPKMISSLRNILSFLMMTGKKKKKVDCSKKGKFCYSCCLFSARKLNLRRTFELLLKEDTLMTKEGDETYLGTTLDSSLEKKELNNASPFWLCYQ